jgi:hypothetical protein
MKRDMGLWRRILIDVENTPAGQPYGYPKFADIDPATLAEHCRLLIEADMLEGRAMVSGPDLHVMILRLTNRGHDLLATIAADTVWSRIGERAKSVGGAISIEVLKALATAVVKETLGV